MSLRNIIPFLERIGFKTAIFHHKNLDQNFDLDSYDFRYCSEMCFPKYSETYFQS